MSEDNQSPVVLIDGGGDVGDWIGEKCFSTEDEELLGISDQNDNPLVSFAESGDGDEDGELEQFVLSKGLVPTPADQNENPLVPIGEIGEDGEQFFPAEAFLSADTAVDWDMLMSRGNAHAQPTRTHWERDSLYVKFDPLIASKRDAADRVSFMFKAPKAPGPSMSTKLACGGSKENVSLNLSENGSTFLTAREDFTMPIMEEASPVSPGLCQATESAASSRLLECFDSANATVESPKNVRMTNLEESHNENDTNQATENQENVATSTPPRSNNVSMSMSMLAEGLLNLNLVEDPQQNDGDKDILNTTIIINEESPPGTTTRNENAMNINFSMFEQEGFPNANDEDDRNGNSKNVTFTAVEEGLMNLNLMKELSANDNSENPAENNDDGDTPILNLNASLKIETSASTMEKEDQVQDINSNKEDKAQDINSNEKESTQSEHCPSTSNEEFGDNNIRTMSGEHSETLDCIAEIKERINKLKLEEVEQTKHIERMAAEKELELIQVVDGYIQEKEDLEATKQALKTMEEGRDQATEDLLEMESKFAELLMMYEGVKAFQPKLEQNSEIFQQREVVLNQILKKRDEIELLGQQEADRVIEMINKDFEQILKEQTEENIKLKARTRMSEMKTSKLEGEIAQLDRENEKLHALCDDLVEKKFAVQ